LRDIILCSLFISRIDSLHSLNNHRESNFYPRCFLSRMGE